VVDEELRTRVKSLLGSLMFPAGWTRPDTLYATITLARHAHNPCKKVLDAAMRILKFLVATKDRGLLFSSDPKDWHGHSKDQLYAFADSSWADVKPSRKSTTGFLIFLHGCPIGMRTKQSPIVVGSTAHAEYVAANLCSEDVLSFRDIMEKLGFPQTGPTPIYEDNTACIAIAGGKSKHASRHVDVKYHFLREQVRLLKIVLVPTSTKDQWADCMTKALGRIKFWEVTAQFMYFSSEID